jgi:hypothetical protein
MALFKEKYKFLFILLFLFLFHYSFAQKEYNSWVFYTSCSFIFNNNQLQVNTIPNPIGGWEAVICDKYTGQLLFYSDGQSAYDRTGNVMPNGAGLLGCDISSQGALIVPDPADDSSYYLFTTDCDHAGGYNGLNYNIVNMRLNGGLGDIEKKNVYVCSNFSEKVTAVRACNFDGFWIITYEDTLNDFFAWRLTANGINVDSPVISSSGFPGYSNVYDDVGCLKASPNGNMLICGFGPNSDTCAYLYNFNKGTGAISLQTKIPWSNTPNYYPQQDFGVSFSPDNSKAYFTNVRLVGSTDYFNLYQYDLNTGIVTLINQNNPNTGLTGMQLGPDSRLYISNSQYNYVAVVNQPDSVGLACNFNLNGVSVAPHLLFWDLPNDIDALYYPDTLFAPSFSYSVNCADSTVAFTDNSNITPQEWWWSFGDIGSGGNNHSTLQNPAHHFTQPGTYTISMWAYEGCSVDSVIKTVTMPNCNAADLIIPTLMYGGGSQTQWQIINLPPNTAATIYDELGRVLYKTSNYPNNYNMRNLPPAMYFYRLDLQDGEELTGKIVVVK